MRALLLLLIPAAFALDNAHRFTDRTGSTQTGRIMESHVFFPAGDIPNYPQPYMLGGSAITPWQSTVEARWPDGSVQRAMVFYNATVTGSGTTAVEFRNNSNPCSSGNQAACDAAGLNQAGMLAFNGGTWDFSMEVTASPSSGTTTVTKAARTIMGAGNWRYLYRGPVLTRVRVGDNSTSRADDFGWRAKMKSAVLTGSGLFAADSQINVVSANGWSAYTRPFKMLIEDPYVGNEVVSVCYVDESINRIYIGTTNGSSSACATSAGRAQDGTTALNSNITGNVVSDVQALIQPTARLTAAIDNYSTSFPVDSVSNFTSGTPFMVLMNNQAARICNISGLNLIVGIGAWGCSADAGGRHLWTGSANNRGLLASHFVYQITGTAYWENAPVDTYKSLHPEFELDFWTGWSGVGCQFLLYNIWGDRLQDQRYDYTFKQGTTTVASNTAMLHRAQTVRIFPVVSTANNRTWNGSAPGEVKTDYNLAWLKYVGVLPYDPNVTLTAYAIGQELTGVDGTQGETEYGWDHANHSRCEMDNIDPISTPNKNASWVRYFILQGGRPEIGLFHRSFATAAISWASSLTNAHRLNEKAYGLGACAGTIPVYIREGTVRSRFFSTTGKYCQGGGYTYAPTDTTCVNGSANYAADAFGRPPSLDLRPGMAMNYSGSGAQVDYYYSVGLTTDGYYVQAEMAHYPASVAYFPWLITGATIYKELQQMSGASRLLYTGGASPTYASNPGASNADLDGRYQYRFGAWGWIARTDHIRYKAWGMREVIHAAYASDQGTPEYEYFVTKMKRNAAMDEGAFNMTTGNFYTPCPSPLSGQYDHSPWCAGRHYKGMNSPVYRTKIVYGDTFFGDWNASVAPAANLARTRHVEGDWMYSFWYIVMGQAEQLGFTFWRPLRISAMERLLGHLKQSAYNPYRAGAYYAPETTCIPEGVDASPDCSAQVNTQGNQIAFSTFANEMLGWLPAARTPLRWCSQPLDAAPCNETDYDAMGGYARYVNAAAAWLPDGVTSVDEVTGKTLTGTSAWEWLTANVKYSKNHAGGSNPNPGDNNAFLWERPNAAMITNLHFSDVTDNKIYFTAPDGGACTYAVNPATSSTSGDSAVSGGNRNHSISLAGRTAGDKVRITCDWARAVWTVQ